MIISASRRTDIPCYYGEWFLNRLKEGYVLVRNPFNHSQVYKTPLGSDVVDCIVFWTKDPKNFLPYLSEVDDMGYKYYFQFTLTPYGKDIERNMRDKNDVVKTFIELSEMIGKDKVVWRYDPVLLAHYIDIDYHKRQFAYLCERLASHTKIVVVSYVDRYSKIKSDYVRDIAIEEIFELSEFMGKTAREYGLAPKACCEELDLTAYGIQKSSCIDKELVESICGYGLNVKQDRSQRKNCGCVESIDIGVYNTCMNGCIYCYANYSIDSCKARFIKHDPLGEMLFGNVKDEIIKERKVKKEIIKKFIQGY